MRALHILILTALVAGCATPAERAMRAEREVNEMIQVYGPACNKLGYQQESDAWRGCVLHLAAKDDLRYNRFNNYPTTTHCFGHRGFFDCTTF